MKSNVQTTRGLFAIGVKAFVLTLLVVLAPGCAFRVGPPRGGSYPHQAYSPPRQRQPPPPQPRRDDRRDHDDHNRDHGRHHH